MPAPVLQHEGRYAPSRVKERDHSAKQDCLFLAFLVFCSALPYIFNLGFYTDDWAYLSVLVGSSRENVFSMFRALMASDPSMLVRPVQVAYLVLSFKAFGLHPLPYHMVNTALLATATLAVYLVFRDLGWGRVLALSTAAVFGFLPHYSPDRFWISVHNVTLSMAFALLGIYALSKATRSETSAPVKWTVVATASLTLSIFSYEITLGLIAAALLLWRCGHGSIVRKTQQEQEGIFGRSSSEWVQCFWRHLSNPLSNPG